MPTELETQPSSDARKGYFELAVPWRQREVSEIIGGTSRDRWVKWLGNVVRQAGWGAKHGG